jgi:hypothetical protein
MSPGDTIAAGPVTPLNFSDLLDPHHPMCNDQMQEQLLPL